MSNKRRSTIQRKKCKAWSTKAAIDTSAFMPRNISTMIHNTFSTAAVLSVTRFGGNCDNNFKKRVDFKTQFSDWFSSLVIFHFQPTFCLSPVRIGVCTAKLVFRRQKCLLISFWLNVESVSLMIQFNWIYGNFYQLSTTRQRVTRALCLFWVMGRFGNIYSALFMQSFPQATRAIEKALRLSK